MNPATSLSLVAAAVEGVMALLAVVFSKAPGWGQLRVFAVVAASAAAYSANNTFFTIAGVSDQSVVWALRFNYLAACVHCAAWLVYSRVQYGETLRGQERGAIAVLVAAGLIGLLPGVLTTDQIEAYSVGWAGVTYHTPLPTAAGSILMSAPPLVLLAPLACYYRKARKHVPGARAHFLAFCIFFLLAVNETLVTLGLLESIYLADLGFLVAVLSVLSEMASRVAGDANRLLTLSATLSRQVDSRTREVIEARESLVRAERLTALGRLSASVGHEINNPLSYVVGNLEYALSTLDSRGGVPGQVLDALNDARGGAERIGRIVRELRVFGRGTPVPQRELTNPCEALESALKLTGNELRCRARLARVLEAVPPVLADPTQLTQVFVNVLLNAAQAIPETRTAGSTVITVRTRKTSDGMVAIEVVDPGRGISESDQRRLFEPFFTTKPQDQGTGLGLFVSLGIISSFGGRIEIDSTLGEGTTVRILLPPAPSDAQVKRTSSRPPASERERRLLVVDDDVLVARSIVRLLSGHRVEVATSGREALARLLDASSRFDLVFCDLMMPDMTGMDLFETIERSRPMLARRFVFISGGGVTDGCRKFIENHPTRVVSKPIDRRALDRVLAEHVA